MHGPVPLLSPPDSEFRPASDRAKIVFAPVFFVGNNLPKVFTNVKSSAILYPAHHVELVMNFLER